MRLFEFANDDPLRIKLITIADQLKDRYQHASKPMSTDAFLEFLNNNDITVGVEDLRDMIHKAPLANVIDDIKGDQVIFKGQQQEPRLPTSPDQAERTVANMAKHAIKK